LINEEVSKIRELENLKEKEIKEAQRQAVQIISNADKEIEQMRGILMQEAEEKFQNIQKKMLNDNSNEVEAILKQYQNEANQLEKEVKSRLNLVINYLIGKVWEEDGN